MTRRNLTTDVCVAMMVLVVSLAILRARGIGNPAPESHHLDAAATGLAVVAAAVLLVSRRLPLLAYVVASLANLTLLVLDYALDIPIAALVALYHLAWAHGGDPNPLRRGGRLLAAALFVPATYIAYALTDETPRLVPEMLVTALFVIGVWVIGDRARLRRDHILELEERARRSERDAERERRLAAAEERTRIARELHDSAGHAITVIAVQAGAARLLHERDPQRALRAVTTIEEVARRTVGDIDRMVRALRSEEPAELTPAEPSDLEELVAHHRDGGLDVSAELSGSHAELPRSVAWATYRIVQESLTNAARHGRGSARVRVSFEADAVAITVTNPTPVTVPERPARTGHGIVGMRERSTLLGGTLTAGARDGQFEVRARLPYGEVTA